MSLNLNKVTWKHVAFGDVVRNVNQTVRDTVAAGIDRVIAMEHMNPGELQIQRWGSLEDGTTFRRRVRPGQTLFGKRRAYQRKVAYVDFGAICSSDILTFEADGTQMLPEFLPFLVQSNGFFDHALGTSAGSLSPRTNWRDLANFEFDLPPLDEQRRIANLLWAVEVHARSIRKARAAASFAKSTWLEGKTSELLDRGSVPFSELWSRSPESGWSAAPVDEETGRYTLSLAALGAEGYRPGNLKNIPDTVKARQATLRAGDLLISRANTADTVGRAGIFSENRSDVSFPDTMMRISLRDDVEATFAVAVIGSEHGRAHMRRSAAGSATSMVKINRLSLGRMRFPVASLDEQALLLAELGWFDAAVAAVDVEAESVAALRASLLTDIFGGNN